ncbi:hypothetical protein DFS34DRAFT_629324 [Phlyctochytrium arcticum]|nr:hypothetical protein DFS34DRAFT_629324 [Phlyctochytrium arcticum]
MGTLNFSSAAFRQLVNTPSAHTAIYRLFQGIILFLRSIAPLSYVYLAWFYLHFFHQGQGQNENTGGKEWSVGLAIFTVVMMAEAVWLPVHLMNVRSLQKRRPSIHHLCKTKAQRVELLENCFDALDAAAGVGASQQTRTLAIQKVVSGWFFGAPLDEIHAENLHSWVAWAFLDEDYDTLNEQDQNQVADLSSMIEKRLGAPLKPGRNPNVKCVRICIDPVMVKHRPLVYYVVTRFVNWYATNRVVAKKLGFYQRTVDPSDVAGSGPYSFWYRPASEPTPPNATPLVFIHGIGIGFAPYLQLLALFPRSVPIYLIEWRYVSMQLDSSVPSIPDTLAGLKAMLALDGHPRATFAGHSLGTIAISWLLNSPIHRPLVASTVLMDPISLLLCDPTVAFNFLHRKPTTIMQLLMTYFVAQETYIANALSRHFHWTRNVLFWHQLPRTGVNMIVLSGRDEIVPSARVKNYLDTMALSEFSSSPSPSNLDINHHQLPTPVASELDFPTPETIYVEDAHTPEPANDTISIPYPPHIQLSYYPTFHHGELLIWRSSVLDMADKLSLACGATPSPLAPKLVRTSSTNSSSSLTRRRRRPRYNSSSSSTTSSAASTSLTPPRTPSPTLPPHHISTQRSRQQWLTLQTVEDEDACLRPRTRRMSVSA